ncbi:hypothetical protein CKAH01_19013 [Colletotrichum kahawae]|uniref:Uncharacterized protein n=1 Tax=Colletotrichum kahawae TaxID=34407 RepID=A0AAD9Y3V2_COLKA|nr:hypothetical protein CKAH01_19013 [Colletotrichum kahawae]
MHDDHSQDQPGYSFLHDDCNKAWVGKGKGWIARRIAELEAWQQAWLDLTRGIAAAAAAAAAVAAAGEAEEATSNHSNSHHPYRKRTEEATSNRSNSHHPYRKRTEEATSNRSNSHHPYRKRTVQAYKQALESFREQLWMLMHMVAGQPAQAPELAGIRHSNTANSRVRNVFAHNSMICFVISYHKNYRQTGTAKVIYWYLLREVGELLVWYLWLVLPFWQQVGGIIHQTDQKSAFLWVDDVVVRGRAAGEASRDNTRGDERCNNTKDNDACDNTEDDDACDNTITDESANATPSWAPWTDERLWTSDKARRIMQQHSGRLVSSKINISRWRHMAVAIANRYLNEAFGRADDRNNDNNDNEDDDDDGTARTWRG